MAQDEGYVYAIQCKKYCASHIKQKDILDFVHNIKHLKAKHWNKIRFYFITTSRVNRYARKVADKNWIIIRDYKDILHINKALPIDDFIERNKWNAKILQWIDAYDVLDMFYIRKAIKQSWLADALYFILKHTLFRFRNFGVDYQKIEKDNKSDYDHDYSFLEKESPIASGDTFVWEVG